MTSAIHFLALMWSIAGDRTAGACSLWLGKVMKSIVREDIAEKLRNEGDR